MAKKEPNYEVLLGFAGIFVSSTGVETYCPLQPGDQLRVECGPGGVRTNGAIVSSRRYGRIRVNSQDLVARCQRITFPKMNRSPQ
ncbi:hypothetical protein ACFQ3L_00865 [Lacticaseibacillus jixianensis]|uniref:Uncharacterized protein n=1 Tax=Lacticaseibacillus jixianensis TaxID=2486012 RepID=A0ABW4B7L3_9LACO|nr:hypothetical protein [Lacticaseibacillus jixianensis]